MSRLLFILLFTLAGIVTYSQSALLAEIDEFLFDARYAEAIERIDRITAADLETKFRLSIKKSEALIRLGKYNEASDLLKQVMQNSGTGTQANIRQGIALTSMGFLQLNEGRNDLAEKSLQQAVIQLSGITQKLDLGQALSYLGLVYWSNGKYVQAEENQLMALSLRKESLPENHELIAASYNDLGLIYSQLDVDKAIEYYEMAAQVYEVSHGKSHPKLAITNTNLGLAYLTIELYGDAINYFETALTIWSTLYPGNHPSKALVLTNIGRTYAKMGDAKTAMRFYEDALTMYRSVHGEKHPDIASTLNLIGNQLLASQKTDAALDHFQQALQANSADFNSFDWNENPEGVQYYNGVVLLYSLMYKGQALEARHFTQTLRQRDLVTALQTLQVSDKLVDQLRKQSTHESDKISVGAIANEIYADGVRISTYLSHASFRDRKQYRELSFYFAEKSKSAVLLDAISDTNAKSFAGIPNHVLEQEAEIKASLAVINQKLAEMPAASEREKLRNEAFVLNQHYQQFISNLEREYPAYFNLKFNTTSPSITDIQQKLSPHTAVISYFIDEKNSRIYRYTITKSRFTIVDHLLPKDFDRYITGYRNSIYYMSDEVYAFTARELYKLLQPTVPSSVRDVIIIPTGRLSVVPFEALLVKDIKGQSLDYNNLPYLIRKYSIRYEFSAGVLLQSTDAAKSSIFSSALLMAPVSFAGNDNMNDLPGTEREIQKLNALLTASNIPTEVLMKTDANKTSVKETLSGNFSLIHFATHGVVDESNPELSRVYLYTKPGDTDGNLYSGELYNLRLTAQLVTLSACQTGLGKLSKGEGVIGLSRALVYAGAEQIIVSFWNVADESTAEMMTDFYRVLVQQSGTSVSTGLQQAKINMIKGGHALPFFWAPFILIGN
jgi:CHAT domain-containing protein